MYQKRGCSKFVQMLFIHHECKRISSYLLRILEKFVFLERLSVMLESYHKAYFQPEILLQKNIWKLVMKSTEIYSFTGKFSV